jgi:hypothetical protein
MSKLINEVDFVEKNIHNENTKFLTTNKMNEKFIENLNKN